MRGQIHTITALTDQVSAALPNADLASIRGSLEGVVTALRQHFSIQSMVVCPNLRTLSADRGFSRLGEHSKMFQLQLEFIGRAFDAVFEQMLSGDERANVQHNWNDVSKNIAAFLKEEEELYARYDEAVALPPSLANRRKIDRIPCEGVAVIGTTPSVMGRVKDLSLEGVYVQAPLPLPSVGEDIKMWLRIPGLAAPLETMVRVCHHGALGWSHQAPGMGATFLDLGTVDQAKLTLFLNAA